MNKLDSLLYEFLVEDSKMPVEEFVVLTEETKMDTIIQIANDVFHSLQKKVKDVDTFYIDKTRGEIKNFSELSTIQDVIQKLTNFTSNYIGNLDPKLLYFLREITKAIYNLNKCSQQYKDAYRTKKTILIMSYQTVVLSIISSLSYIVSAVIDFKNPNQLQLKKDFVLEEILPMKSIIDFNKMVDNGALAAATKDVGTLREFFTEYSVNELSTIYEAIDIINMVNSGISAFSNAMSSGRLNGILFKVLGVVMLILSFRDVFYTLSNSRTKISEKLQGLKTFLNTSGLSNSAASRFNTFNNKNAIESINTSKSAEQEIASENKEIIYDVKNKPTEFDMSSNDYIPAQSQGTDSTTNDIFADFNF